MIEITYGMTVYTKRATSTGDYFECYKVSEMTGRKLSLVTVVPFRYWDKPSSPYCEAYQIPISELISQEEFESMDKKNCHPAMVIAGLLKPNHLVAADADRLCPT